MCKESFINPQKIKEEGIDISAYKGIVRLSGFVDTPEAEQIAGNTKGKVG
ncbi:MAG: hypothetical protein ACYDFU_04555 [Nitrospirota bacterium]